jgi:hypothetical protein
MPAAKKTARKSKRARKLVAKKAKRAAAKSGRAIGGVSARELPELPPEVMSLSRKYGTFW